MAMTKAKSKQLTHQQPGTGAVVRTVYDKITESVSVLDFGADPTGDHDSTAAFNLATKASYTSTGNFDQNFPGDVFVPAGVYKITGTVYIHKGQHLHGAGQGASKIDCSGMSAYSGPVFKLGFSSSAEDAGGLAPEISELWTTGGPSSYGVIDMQVAGATAHHLFMTSVGIGLKIGGGDTIVSSCIIDQGLSAIVITGQNHIIDSVLLYNMNYGITVNSDTYDVQIGDCHFEYGIYDDILFATSATNIKNVTIQDCQFVKNAQYATSDQAIHIRSNAAEIFIHGCTFRNQRGYSINIPTGVGNNLRVSNCIFNGNRTNQVYTQSTTAAGIYTQYASTEITNCQFINLFGNPIGVGGAGNYNVVVKGCSYKNIATATQFATITATAGSLSITDCVGDNVLPLINLQSNIRPRLKNNTQWLGAAGNSGGRFFWKIPTTGAAIVRVGITANSFAVGNLNYRDASAVYAARSIDWSGAFVQDVAAKSTTYETTAQTLIGPLDIQVDLDSVGGGATAAYSLQGRYLVVSVPNTYYYPEIEADYTV